MKLQSIQDYRSDNPNNDEILLLPVNKDSLKDWNPLHWITFPPAKTFSDELKRLVNKIEESLDFSKGDDWSVDNKIKIIIYSAETGQWEICLEYLEFYKRFFDYDFDEEEED
jgi:hypothetical protein